MKNQVSVESIRGLIGELKAAERVTKKTLATLSRDLVQFVFLDGNDTIELVNELLIVLTPMNRKTANAFFKHHLPWGFNPETNVFESKFDEGKRYGKKFEASKEFLADPANTIWTWADRNIDVQFVEPDMSGAVQSAVKKALKGKKNPDGEYVGAIQPHEVLLAVMQGGVSAEQILGMIDAITEAAANEPEKPAQRENPEAEGKAA